MRDREKKRQFKTAILAAFVILGASFFGVSKTKSAAVTSIEKFRKSGYIDEAESMEKSSSADWWVNSGAKLRFKKGVGRTIQKNLSQSSKWRKLYAKTNSEDTDNGAHPQNIFRLITRSRWQNFSQQAYFRIKKVNLSASENRNESNGILLFNRYEDSDDLYYAGLRVDGYAVIKKKINGEYYFLDYRKIFGKKKYDRKNRPNLLPKNKWIGLKTEVRNIEDGKVEIKLFVEAGKGKRWTLAASAIDENGKYGGEGIAGEGYGGIRTDFMDVEFDKFRITEW